MKLALHVPINPVSFGQTATMLLRSLYDREKAGDRSVDLYVFPIGNADLSAQQLDEGFGPWLQSKVTRAFNEYNRNVPVFKLWHLNGSLESYGTKQTLLTFYELDNPTRVELNIARNNRLLMSSQYALDVFRMFGVEGQLLPLAFDTYNFKKLDKQYHTDGRIVFNICGKLERRKHHAKVIQTWIKKWGKNPKYWLQCATFNPFLGRNQQECEQNNNEMIRQIIAASGGDKPFNVNFYPMMKENVSYNDFLNSADIIIGMSGGEGWGLPEFQSVAMGKHAVLLNAHAYKTWATNDMVTWVQPSGKVSSVDNMFFRAGDAFNQGNIFDWNPDDFVTACETAIKKVEASRTNTAGLSLQTTYSKDRFVDSVIKLSTE